MTTPHRSSWLTDGEVVTMAIAAALVTSGGAIAATGWDSVVQWLLDHGLLVAAAAEPLLPVPGSAGAGLDLARLLLLGAGLVTAAALCGSWLLRRRQADGED